MEALGDELTMEDELKEEEDRVPRYIHSNARPNEDSYLEGVTAPDGPILEKPDGSKDGKLGETAS